MEEQEKSELIKLMAETLPFVLQRQPKIQEYVSEIQTQNIGLVDCVVTYTKSILAENRALKEEYEKLSDINRELKDELGPDRARMVMARIKEEKPQ